MSEHCEDESTSQAAELGLTEGYVSANKSNDKKTIFKYWKQGKTKSSSKRDLHVAHSTAK